MCCIRLDLCVRLTVIVVVSAERFSINIDIKNCLLQGQIAVARLELAVPVCCEIFKDHPHLGRFTLRDEGLAVLDTWLFVCALHVPAITGKTIGIGRILKLRDGEAQIPAAAPAAPTAQAAPVAAAASAAEEE